MPETTEKPVILSLSKDDARFIAGAVTLTMEMILGKEMTVYSIINPRSKVVSLLQQCIHLLIDDSISDLDQCEKQTRLKVLALGELCSKILAQTNPEHTDLAREVEAHLKSLKQKL